MARPSLTVNGPLNRDHPLDEQELTQSAPYAQVTAVADDQDLDQPVAELVNRKRRHLPRGLILVDASIITPAGPLTYNFMDLGGPPAPHRIYNVMRYNVWGINPDPFSTVTGSVLAYIGTALPQAPNSNTWPSVGRIIDTFTSIPAVAPWSGHQLTLHFGEHIILAFKGVPAATQLMAQMQVEEEDERDFRVDRD